MTSKKRYTSGWLIQAAIWVVILVMPFFTPQPGRPLGEGINYIHFIPVIVSFMAVFYVNYLWLIKKYLLAKRFGIYILLNVALVAVVSLLVHLTFSIFFTPSQGLQPRPPQSTLDHLSFISRNTIIYAVIIGISIAVKMTSELYRSEAERKEIERGKAEAELANLKSQVNPHFLFNTLNNIYSLIQLDPQRAQAAVRDLSSMMRYVLYDSEMDYVPLSKEIKFIQDYIKLMEMRLSANVKVSFSAPAAGSARQVAPLLFIPLVENAFKHGVSDTEESFINVEIREEDGYVVCVADNSNFPKTDSDRSGSGIGISNLKRRLEALYPGRYSFEYGPVQNTYHCVLKINTI